MKINKLQKNSWKFSRINDYYKHISYWGHYYNKSCHKSSKIIIKKRKKLNSIKIVNKTILKNSKQFAKFLNPRKYDNKKPLK